MDHLGWPLLKPLDWEIGRGPLGGILITRGKALVLTKLFWYFARVANSCSCNSEGSHCTGSGVTREHILVGLLLVLGLVSCVWSTSLSLYLSW